MKDKDILVESPRLANLSLGTVAVYCMMEMTFADGDEYAYGHLVGFHLTKHNTERISREGATSSCKKRLDGLTATEALMLGKGINCVRRQKLISLLLRTWAQRTWRQPCGLRQLLACAGAQPHVC